MNLQAIEMDKAKALAAYQDYADALRKKWNQEDATLKKGYRALAQGKRVIELTEIIKAGGLDEKGRPRLAIVRADAKEVFLRRSLYENELSFSMDDWPEKNRRITMHNIFESVPESIRAKAVVPSIPPEHRPIGSLFRYYILWEASWEDVPKDPALLRRIGPILFVVIAEWNLTPLEQAVLKGRL